MSTQLSVQESMPDTVEVFRDISLRVLATQDAADIADILVRDPSIRELVTWVHGIEGEAAIAEALSNTPSGTKRYGIRNGDKLAGYLALSKGDQEGSFDLGYFLDPDERGQGVITKSVAALVATAISKLDASRLRAYIADDNEASQRIVKAFGFERTETVKHDEILRADERLWEMVIG